MSARLPDLLCVSHLRFDAPRERTHHLMMRFARERRVFWIEPPRYGEVQLPRLEIRDPMPDLRVAVPHLPVDGAAGRKALAALIAELVGGQVITGYVLWCDTPAALAIGQVLRPRAVVYDCVDELAARATASPILREQERALLGCCDLVTAAGHGLYEAKRLLHRNVHLMLNSVDRGAFLRA